ncbi:MAG TPA: helix-turn-helix transcriptional regulator [Saccharofermentans sp.]|nr:helix-turn-helix transcriptional regulator [Saccharofermentans sp.]
MDYQELGSRIRQHRTQKGWTQEGLAQRISVSTSFVGHLERGSRKASLETIVSISNALSISMDYLLAGSLDTTVIGPVPNALSTHQAAVFKKIITVILDNLDKWK